MIYVRALRPYKERHSIDEPYHGMCGYNPANAKGVNYREKKISELETKSLIGEHKQMDTEKYQRQGFII